MNSLGQGCCVWGKRSLRHWTVRMSHQKDHRWCRRDLQTTFLKPATIIETQDWWRLMKMWKVQFSANLAHKEGIKRHYTGTQIAVWAPSLVSLPAYALSTKYSFPPNLFMMFWQPRQVHPKSAHAKNKSSEHYKRHFTSMVEGGGGSSLLLQQTIHLKELQGTQKEGCELRPAWSCLFWEVRDSHWDAESATSRRIWSRTTAGSCLHLILNEHRKGSCNQATALLPPLPLHIPPCMHIHTEKKYGPSSLPCKKKVHLFSIFPY